MSNASISAKGIAGLHKDDLAAKSGGSLGLTRTPRNRNKTRRTKNTINIKRKPRLPALQLPLQQVEMAGLKRVQDRTKQNNAYRSNRPKHLHRDETKLHTTQYTTPRATSLTVLCILQPTVAHRQNNETRHQNIPNPTHYEIKYKVIKNDSQHP